MRKIRINRKKWLNGSNNNGNSVLWDSCEKKGCCLGHAIHQVSGKSWESLDSLFTPEEVFQRQDVLGLTKREGWFESSYQDSDFTERAIAINDNINISDMQREKRLIKLFRKNKIRLSFYD